MGDVTHTLRMPFVARTFELTGPADDFGVMRAVTAHDYYEPDVMWLLQRFVQPEWTLLDVGANIGALTLAMASMVPDGYVHAFEPVAQTYAYLSKNIANSGLHNVSAHDVALSDRSGVRGMSYDATMTSGAHLSKGADRGERVEVNVVTLDDWAAGLERLDLVKIDVEGHELQVLRGARRTFERFHPYVVIEVNPVTQTLWGDGSIDDLYAAIKQLGRWRFWIRPDGGISWIASRRHLDRVLQTKGYVDVFVTDRPPRTTLHRSTLRAIAGGIREDRALTRRLARPPVTDEPRFVLRPNCRLELAEQHVDADAGAAVRLRARLHNNTSAWMASDVATHAFTVRHRWLDAQGMMIREAPEPARFPRVAPRETVEVTVEARAPEEPGRYGLLLSVVQEAYAWHADLDPRVAAIVPVTVHARGS